MSEGEEKEYRYRKKRRQIIIAVSTFLLLAIIIGATIGAVINNQSNKSNSKPSSSSAVSIKAACSVTEYPDSCYTSIHSAHEANATTNPVNLFKWSVQVALLFIFHSISVATGRNFIARDMGFENTAGPQNHQAVALRSSSDFSLFYRCSFRGYQDTLYAHSLRQFYRECEIVGTIDFIFGDASAVFQNCTIMPRQPMPSQKNTITAQGRTDPNEPTGISIQGCVIKPFDEVSAPTYLGRPWKEYATTVVMQSEIDKMVDAAGWLEFDDSGVPPSKIFYGEFRNFGGGAGLEKRVDWPGYRKEISRREAEGFAVESFILGEEWIPATGIDFVGSV